MDTATYDEKIRQSYELAAELLPRWRKLQADIANSMLYNQAVHGREFMAEPRGRQLVGVTAGEWVADNISALTELAIDPNKDCPIPIIARLLETVEQSDALTLIPPMAGNLEGRKEAIAELRGVDTTDPTEAFKGAEYAIFKMVEFGVQDMFAIGGLEWVPMPEFDYYYPDGKDTQAKGELITCDDCTGSDCLFNEANANNPAIWVCLAQEIARDRDGNVQDYVIEIEGYGDGFRLVNTWTGCGGTERDVLISAHTAKEFHSELVRLLVGAVDEVKAETPGFAKEPQPA